MHSATYSPRGAARLSGLLYLCVIAFGVGGALLVRAPLIDTADLAGSVSAMAEAALPFRLSILADLAMTLADVALALVFFRLFRPVSAGLSLAAMSFRLLQAGILALNLVNLFIAISCAEQGEVAWTMRLLSAHDAGYALALFFFALHCLCLARLICHQNFMPRVFAPVMGLTALVYLLGSALRLAFPTAAASIAPIYALAFVLELALCLWLLMRGVDEAAWKRMAAAAYGWRTSS